MGRTTPKSAQMHPGPGYRIRKSVERPDGSIVKQFLGFDAPAVSDMLNRMYTMDSGIRSMTDNVPLVGTACTVKVFPGDNLMVHKALDVAKPGDVIVIDGGSSSMNALIGDLITTKAKHRGVVGFVVDGLIRDVEEVRKVGLPVFARGITPIGPLHRGPGEINFEVSCGGIVVNPGDIIVADMNGVVVIRRNFASEVLERLYAQKQSLEEYESQVKQGNFSNAWADEYLKMTQCNIEGDHLL